MDIPISRPPVIIPGHGTPSPATQEAILRAIRRATMDVLQEREEAARKPRTEGQS